MGGMIAQEMVRIASSKILKIIFYSTGPIGEMPGRFETVSKSRKNLKQNGLNVTARNIAKTWFVKGDKAKYFDICIKSGRETSFEAADNALIAFEKWNEMKH